jgi:metal-responsive CopG/Arc/MetJ family transcriptional regulator
MVTRTAKLTISLPQDLVTFADKMASEKGVTRSKIVSMCLQDMAEKHKAEAMKDGYLAMAKQHVEFAKMTSEIAHEVVPE